MAAKETLKIGGKAVAWTALEKAAERFIISAAAQQEIMMGRLVYGVATKKLLRSE